MTPAEMFRTYLLVGEQITVELPTEADAKYLLQLLRTEKSRSTKQFVALGMESIDPLQNMLLTYDILEQLPESIKITLRATAVSSKRNRLSFTILTSAGEQQDGTGT